MTHSLPDFTGQHVRQYHLISLLGSGSSGRVYRAVDTASKRQCSYAIKCMPKVGIPKGQLAMQLAEISAHRMVSGSSAYILSLRNVFEDDLYVWVVLEFCEGGDLHKAIFHARVFSGNEQLIKKSFLEILDGVSACHKKGIFHRDLKPENILCNADGTGIRIADFGHATRDRLSRGALCGTRQYLSPEYWVGGESNITFPPLADIWSLGIILINLAFMEEEDYLFKMLPISLKLNTLLKWMLHPCGHRRISIPQIRQEIVNMETFYRRPSLPRSAAWSREVAFDQATDFYNDSNSNPQVNGGDMKAEVAHIEFSNPHDKVWGPVRERWVVKGVEMPAVILNLKLKPAGWRVA